MRVTPVSDSYSAPNRIDDQERSGDRSSDQVPDRIAESRWKSWGWNWIAALSAFSVYFCMYAFRKPFTAGTFDGQEAFGLDLKTVLVLSQLCGYMLSKFIGVKVVSEMPRSRRAISLVLLVGVAELALLGFAWLPIQYKFLMLFLNGLPLGMVFGIVLAYLEGRKQTEALAAGLCASFIVSSGVVKSVGRSLIEDYGVSEFHMPYITGALFLGPLLLFIWILHQIPEPTAEDREIRSERSAMSRSDRRAFFAAYAPGLSLLLFTYIMLTIIRTVRDDFGVEIWQGLGVTEKPSVFARSEIIVGIFATGLNALAIYVVHNLKAIQVAGGLMCFGFALTICAAIGQSLGLLSPFLFMVVCGIGLYIPYVAFHTTMFERIVASSQHKGNLAFLMYLADSIGYLGYAAIVGLKMFGPDELDILSAFRNSLVWGSSAAMLALIVAALYFQSAFRSTAPETSARGAS